MANHNETFRRRVQQILNAWLEQLAACLAQAQKAGEVGVTLDARALAEFCLISWEGAMQRARTLQSITPVELFFKIIFDNFLAGI
jgi:TetR/AcrR family transcriptional repressor of nem operon